MMAVSGTTIMRLDFFNKTRMRQPDRNSNIYELSISRAPQLRCVKSTVKSCMTCEACRLVVVLNQVKEWFIRCGDPAKRRFILGLIHRVDSMDLFSNISFLLQPLQNKDFTYTRSRSRPSLQSDAASPPTNHALNLDSLDKAIEETWQWFADSAYWSKLNFLLGIMQHCDSQLLFIMANSVKTMSKRERLKQRAVDEGILEEDENEYMSLCSEMTNYSDNGESEQSELKSVPSSATSPSPTKVSIEGDGKIENSSSRVSSAFRRSTPASATHSVPCFTSPSLCSRKSRAVHSAPAHAQHTAIQSRHSFHAVESDIFSEDYISGDEDDYQEDQVVRVDPSACVLSSPSYLYSGTSRYKDFIRCLPVHLSKYILKLLDKNSLTNCLCITKHWRILAEEVKSDYMVHQLMTEEIMLMQGASAKGMDPHYAKMMPVHVPLLEDQERPSERPPKAKYSKGRNLKDCYKSVPTKKVILEERNVYCGAYNVLVLQDWEDHHRCTNFSGGRYVTSGSYDRKVRLIDAATGKCERAIQGHAGSIRCLLLSEERDIVLSGSYDTSVRCWDIKRGNCKCIFRGHRATVMCISLHGNNMASGSRDKSVKVWNFATGKCRRTFRHRHVVLDVKVSKDVVISGCEGGKVKVWDIETATLVKSLDGHQGAITCLKFDAYHIITGSMDGYAMAWSAVGQYKKCLQAFRHPKEVLCLEFLYCRVITGSADGKLRIWNLLNGDCLRLIRGNSRNDAINAICATENRIVINTLSNLLIFNFEAVKWDYNLPPERPEGLGTLNLYKKHGPQKLPRTYVRAQRLHRADTKDSLPSRPPSRTAFFFDDGPGKRITSAPPRVAHRDSTVNSINHHVTRITSARKKEIVRPQSSPAKVTTRKTIDECDVSPFTEDDDIRERVQFTKVMQTYPKPPPLPDNRSSNVISRGRSAPVYRTKTLPENKRGWTTSAEESIAPVANKIMLTPSQAKLKMQQRPKSAHIDSKVSISKNPLQSLSCLNLKTYTNQLVFEDEMKKTSEMSNRLRDGKKRAVSADQARRRPQSCI